MSNKTELQAGAAPADEHIKTLLDELHSDLSDAEFEMVKEALLAEIEKL